MKTSETISTKPGFLAVSRKENPSYIYFDWENFSISLDDCVDAFNQAEKAMAKLGVFHIVSDILKVKQGLSPEVGKWWGEVCMPSLAKCGVKLIVNLVPMSGDSKTGESQVANGIVMQTAHTISEAESLVRIFQGGKTIEKEQLIKAAPERVFKALTKKEEMEKWFVQKADLELKSGGDIRVE